MKIIKIVVFFIFIFIFTNCNKPDAWDAVKTSGNIVQQKRVLGNFNTITLKDNINLTIKQDTLNYAVIEAPKNLIDKINTQIENNNLIINNNNTFNWVRRLDNEINVFLSLKVLNYFDFRGSGTVNAIDTVLTDFLQADINDASGSLKLKLKTSTSRINIPTGCADVQFEGASGVNYIYSNGTGKVLCQNLKTGYTFINNNKTNDCFINVNYLLDAETNYVGNIYYSGNPQFIQIKENGSGKIIKLP